LQKISAYRQPYRNSTVFRVPFSHRTNCIAVGEKKTERKRGHKWERGRQMGVDKEKGRKPRQKENEDKKEENETRIKEKAKVRRIIQRRQGIIH
jgi:hypothetical protein